MPFVIVRRDITKMNVDAIVNAANTGLKMGGGVCGAIFRAAGAREMQAACDELAPIRTGEAVITPGFGLPARYVVHTAGPVYRGGGSGEEEQLRSCYLGSLKLALGNGCKSIAFPLISSGIYGYPKEGALRVATAAIREFLAGHDMEVYLAVFDKEALAVSEELLGDIESYIDDHYVAGRDLKRRNLLPAEREALDEAAVLRYIMPPPKRSTAAGAGVEEWIEKLDEPFSAALLRLIDASGRTDVEIYKRANIDRKLFSKIRTGKGYMPGKRTALALALALELTLEQTDDLLERAGYALSRSRLDDVIVEYFIVSGKYDIFEINEVLFKYDQPLLGG